MEAMPLQSNDLYPCDNTKADLGLGALNIRSSGHAMLCPLQWRPQYISSNIKQESCCYCSSCMTRTQTHINIPSNTFVNAWGYLVSFTSAYFDLRLTKTK